MFRETSDQQSLSGPMAWLPEEKRQRLEESWAGTFRAVVVPMIEEKKFKPLYADSAGAPCKSPRAKVCLLLFRELFDLTDEQLVERYEWDLQWHYAIGIPPEQAHLTRKTLYNFRQKLMDSKKAREVFEDIVAALLEHTELTAGRQRQDSTLVVSNVRRLTRLQLFVETIETSLRDIEAEAADVFDRLPAHFEERYGEADGQFGDVGSDRTRRRLEECAQDVLELLDYLADRPALQQLDSVQKLARLFDEQCRRVDQKVVDEDEDDSDREDAGDERGQSGESSGEDRPVVECRSPDEIEPTTMQTPHDPEVEYHGKYGVGYLAQVCETTDAEHPFEVITEVELQGGASSDQNAAVPTLESLAERGLEPETHLVDKGYTGGENLLGAARQGVDLVGPVKEGSRRKDELFGREDFEFADRQDRAVPEVVACPQGHPAVDRHQTETDQGVFEHTRFDRDTCEQCPHKRRCPVMRQEVKRDEREGRTARNRTTDPSLRLKLPKQMVARRRRRQKTRTFKEAYADRAGCEATISEMKRGCGLGDLKVRGRERIELDLYFKAAATNIKRLLAAIAQGDIDREGLADRIRVSLGPFLWALSWLIGRTSRCQSREAAATCHLRLSPAT